MGLDKRRQELGGQLGARCDLTQPLARFYRQSGPPPSRDARQFRQAYRSPSGWLSVHYSLPTLFSCLE